MPSKKLTTSSVYQKLFEDICAIYDAGVADVRKAADEIFKKMYLEMGRRLIKAETEQKNPVDDAQGLENLERDLIASGRKGCSATNLRNMKRVFRAFTSQQTSADLPWSHLVLLSSVEDKKTREEYLQKAQSHKLSLVDLKNELEDKKLLALPAVLDAADAQAVKKDTDSPRLAYKRGIVYTYRIKEVQADGAPRERLRIDGGFYFYSKLRSQEIARLKLKANDIVIAQEDDESWKLKVLNNTNQIRVNFLYTYKAQVVKTIDGDTITVWVDLGFNNESKQKLRFRGINAEEIATEAGQRAKAFVMNRIAKVDFIIIKTHSTDIYDRYLVDVFYLPGEADPQKVADNGIYLNQELLDSSLAQVWQTRDPRDLLTLN